MLALAPEVFFIFSFSKYARLSGGGVRHPARFLRVKPRRNPLYTPTRIYKNGIIKLQNKVPELMDCELWL